MKNGILTVSLNAAVGLSYVVDGFQSGRINTVRELTRVAGGKANNVARVLASLGEKVTATGFAGGSAGLFILEHLRSHGITVDYEETGVDNRTCIAMVDPVGGTLTELREQGPLVGPEHCGRFLDRFRRLVLDAELVILAGSLPPGVPADFYQVLVGEAYRAAQVRTILDATGDALREAVSAQPYMVKPNLDELEEWSGTRLTNEGEVLAAARRLMESGPLVVAVSLGPDGLILVSPEGAWRAVPPVIEPVNTVGSGDSLVAGFAAGLMQGLPAEEILRLAVACGTANALTRTVAVVEPEELQRIRPLVRVTRLP